MTEPTDYTQALDHTLARMEGTDGRYQPTPIYAGILAALAIASELHEIRKAMADLQQAVHRNTVEQCITNDMGKHCV